VSASRNRSSFRKEAEKPPAHPFSCYAFLLMKFMASLKPWSSLFLLGQHFSILRPSTLISLYAHRRLQGNLFPRSLWSRTAPYGDSLSPVRLLPAHIFRKISRFGDACVIPSLTVTMDSQSGAWRGLSSLDAALQGVLTFGLCVVPDFSPPSFDSPLGTMSPADFKPHGLCPLPSTFFFLTLLLAA